MNYYVILMGFYLKIFIFFVSFCQLLFCKHTFRKFIPSIDICSVEEAYIYFY